MPVIKYSLGPMDNNTYIILDEATKEIAVVDPSFDSETLFLDVEKNEWEVRYILNTHAHFDHIIGNALWVEKTGAPLGLHRDDLTILRALPEQGKRFGFEVTPSPDPDFFIEEGNSIQLGETKIDVLFTPGHSPGGVTFVVGSSAIVGDCLFARSVGRTDLPGSSPETLMHSIKTRLLTLPDDTEVLPGHGPATTIGRERRQNPFLKELL